VNWDAFCTLLLGMRSGRKIKNRFGKQRVWVGMGLG